MFDYTGPVKNSAQIGNGSWEYIGETLVTPCANKVIFQSIFTPGHPGYTQFIDWYLHGYAVILGGAAHLYNWKFQYREDVDSPWTNFASGEEELDNASVRQSGIITDILSLPLEIRIIITVIGIGTALLTLKSTARFFMRAVGTLEEREKPMSTTTTMTTTSSSSSTTSTASTASSSSTTTTYSHIGSGEFSPMVGDDMVTVKSGYYLYANTVSIANTFDAFIRFPDVGIPQGATITSAYIKFCSDTHGYPNDTANTLISFNDIDDAIVPTNLIEVQALAKTSGIGNVLWGDIEHWVGGSWYNSPSIVTPIQEVINRAGWKRNNALMVIIEDNCSDGYACRCALANSGYRPLLCIGWTE